MVSKDRFTFEEACKELQVSEDELEQLVANGEIASVKEGDTIFFKKEVIAQFKKARKTEPTIILADSDMEILEGLEEIDLGAKGKAAQAGAGKAPAGGLEGALDEIVIEPRSAEGKAALKAAHEPAASNVDDTVLNLEGLLEDDGSEGTTPIPGAEAAVKGLDESTDITVEGNVSDETLLDTDLLEVVEEKDSFKLEPAAADEVTEAVETTLLRGGGARVMQMKRKESHAPWTMIMVFTAVFLLLPLGIGLSILAITKMGESIATGKDKEPVYQWILTVKEYTAPVFEGIADLIGG